MSAGDAIPPEPAAHLDNWWEYGERDCRITIDDKSAEATVRIAQRFLPTPRLTFQAEIPDSDFLGWKLLSRNDRLRVNLSGVAEGFDVIPLKANSKGGTLALEMVPTTEPLRLGALGEARSLRFQVLNGWEVGLHGSKALLYSDPWTITVQPGESLRDAFGQLRQEGGYATTHWARIELGPEAGADEDEWLTLLEGLTLFMSFVRGSWISPFLATAHDTRDKLIWQELGIRRCDPWRGRPLSCFDSHRGPSPEVIFRQFHECWSTPPWQRALRVVISWYVSANRNRVGVDGSIILAQTALEQFAWTLLVSDRKALTAEGFRRLRAADRISLLVSAFGIPCAVPKSLPGLHKLAKERSLSGPEVLSSVRNQIVHPTDGNVSIDLFEAWQLAQWYIELGLLGLFNYEGTYANRCSLPMMPGKVESVPWAR